MTTSEELLWRSFTIAQVQDCLADPRKNGVVAEFFAGISPVFPYLNAILPNAMYNLGANSITPKRGARILTFYPRVAVLAKVDGAEEAAEQLRWFQELCNDTRRRRAEITPNYQRRKLLGPLDVYRLLPQLNCKACGEATRMAFAFGLLFEGIPGRVPASSGSAVCRGWQTARGVAGLTLR